MKAPTVLLLSLILPILTGIGFPVQGQRSSLPDTIERIRGGVVAIGTFRPVKRTNPKNPPIRFTGTGFVVGKGRWVITNFHVLPDDIDTDNGERLAIFAGRGEGAKASAVRVLRSDPNHDLALLEIEGGALSALTLSGRDFVREGRAVAFTGFPIGMVLGLYPVTHRGIVSCITPMVIPALSSGSLTAQQVLRVRDPFDVYQLDAIAYPGNSGSPVYEVDTGRVIGVVNSVFVKATKESVLARPSGITYVIPVRHVHNLLNR